MENKHTTGLSSKNHLSPNAIDCATTRAVSNGDALEIGRSDLVQSTFLGDTSKAWNKTPKEIKECKNVWSAKKAINKFVSTLPI